jgi:hypothetical protein
MFNATAAYDTMIACLAGIDRNTWCKSAADFVADRPGTVRFFSEIGEEQTGILVDIVTESRAR